MVVNLAIFYLNIKYNKMDKFTFSDLKKAAKELKVPKYTTMKTQPELVKLMRSHAKLVGKKIVSKAEGGRCWSGFKPVKGKKPFSKGSCKKISGGAIYNPTEDPEVSDKNEQIRKNMQKAREAKDKNQGTMRGGAVSDLALKHRNRLVERLRKVKTILGGQLPSSITDKVRDLDIFLGIKGEGLGGGDPFDLSRPSFVDKQIDRRIEENKKDKCEGIAKQCQPLARQIQQTKDNKIMYGDDKLTYKTVNDCSDYYKEKDGCAPKKPRKKGILSKTADVLMGVTDKTLGVLVAGGKPVFYAGCAASGGVAGGPIGAAAGGTACKQLYKNMIEKPGYEDTLMERANLTDKEKDQAELLGKLGGAKGAKEIAGKGVKDKIEWDSIEWGSFKEQFDAYNKHQKKKLKDLMAFALMILKTPEKFQRKTVKRANFYKNVLSKK